jgi:hypothetical protein
MSQTLRGLSAEVLTSGSDTELVLRHLETGKTVEMLPVRKAQESDRSFILATWVRSYAPVARRTRVTIGTAPSVGLEEGVYLAGEPSVAESHWKNSVVLGSPEDEFTIHGWVCGGKGTLYHCYVPPDLRRQGIAKALILHVCGPTLEYARPWPFPKVPSGWKLNPYLLRP